MATTYTKILYGTPTSSSEYNDFGLTAAIADGNFGSGWSSGNAYSVVDYVGYVYPTPTKVRKIELYFHTWGPTIVVGVADSWPVSQAGFTVLRTIDVNTTPNDDLGVPWAKNTVNTILLPANTPSKAALAVWTTSGAANKLSSGGVDRERLLEFSAYTDDSDPPAPIATNPKPPATLPVLPFTAVPNANWTRTEYSAAGTFNFTPAANTSLVLAILQGAGAGGRINIGTDGLETAAIANTAGGDSFISSDNGQLWRAPGGIGILVPDEPLLANPENWLRFLDSGGRTGNTLGRGNTQAAAGVQSLLSGTAGAAWTTAAVDTNSGIVASPTNLGGTGTLPGSVVYNGFTRSATVTEGFVNTGSGAGIRTVEYTINAYAGQILSYNYGRNTSAYQGSMEFQVNGIYQFTDQSAFIGTKSAAGFLVTVSGPQTIKLIFTGNAAALPNGVKLYAILIDGIGYGGSTGGASGRLLQGFMLPKPLTINVGLGGNGITGGQTVPTSANGQRGSGGAGGGKGGDGVVIIYEYKIPLSGESPITPIFNNFNLALATEQVGFYRTNYFSTTRNELVNFRHKLRPRSKAVYAIIVGAGGGVWLGAGFSKTAPPNTKIFTSKVAYEVGSGQCSAGPDGNGSSPGAGGVVVSASGEVLASKNGGQGFGGASSGVTPSGVTGGYGDGASSSAYYWAGGGSGAYALVALGEKDFNSDHSVDITFSGPQFITSTQGTSGAVFIFETETVIGPLTSQTAELVLQKNTIGQTQVTQAAQLVLQKTNAGAPSNTQVTQSVMLILQRNPKSTGTSVTEQLLEVVTTAEPGNARISQNVQSVLVESDPVSQNVTQVASLVLIKENPTIIQVMDFGVMRYPLKNQLYTSLINKIDGVGQGNTLRVQLEGDLPVGSSLIINGVDTGSLTAMVKDGDTIQLKGGVTNYFITSQFLYAYLQRGDQIIREHAGFWSVLQADLAPRKRATIGVVGKFIGMLVSKADSILSGKTTGLKTSGRGVLANALTANVAKENAVIAPKQTAIPDSALAVLLANNGTQVAKDNTVLSGTQTFTARPSPGTIMWFWNNWIARNLGSTANWNQTQTLGAGQRIAKGEVWFRAANGASIAKAEQFWVRGTAQQSSNADQLYSVFKTDEPVFMSALMYTAAKTRAEKFARVAYTYAPTYVFSPIELVEYTVQERDKVAYIGQQWQQTMVHGFAWKTPDWISPAKDNTEVRGKLDFVSAVPVHIHLFGKNDWLTVHMPSGAYRSREFAKLEIGKSSTSVQNWTFRSTTATLSPTVGYAARLSNSTLINVEYRVTKANATLFNMKPILYQAGKNQIDKAKYYMGFTTKAEVDAFIVNFLKPTTKTKLDGYVYRVGTDDTLVCEVRGPNMPIAWLMHGG
jgi:hypothetical protein